MPEIKGLLYLFVVFIPSFSFSQTLAPDLWYKGKAVLENKDTIYGLIKYDIPDLLQVTRDRHAEVFPAEKVLYFQIFDDAVKLSRQFYSTPFLEKGNIKKSIFFELLSTGKLTLFAREGIQTFIRHQGSRNWNERVLVCQYYLLNEDNEVKKISYKPFKIVKLMGDKTPHVRKYVKDNKLDFDSKYDLKRIIDYYNSFFTSR